MKAMVSGSLLSQLLLASLAVPAVAAAHGSALALYLIAGALALAWLLADLGSGIFHWSVDNYGGISTPVFGVMCAAFQGHREFRPSAGRAGGGVPLSAPERLP
jgi:peptidoglycan/LPS O-acetylase OafA/YrhL